MMFLRGMGSVITTKSDFAECSSRYSRSLKCLFVLSCTASRSACVIRAKRIKHLIDFAIGAPPLSVQLHSSASSELVTKSLIRSSKNLTVDSSGFFVMSGRRIRSEKSILNLESKLAIERCSNSSSEFLFARANTRRRHVFQLRRVLMM